MAGGPSRKKPPRKASDATRPRKPVLGNDPFERGAAEREPVQAEISTPAATPASASTSTPTSTLGQDGSSLSPTGGEGREGAARPTEVAVHDHDHDHVQDHDHDHVQDHDHRAGSQDRQAHARPQEGQGRASSALAGLAALEDEAKVAVSRLLPALRARLGTLADLARLLEPAERLDRDGMDARFAERLAPVLDFFYSTWWRVQVRGVDAIPAAGPAVVVANHAGVVPWDALVLRHAALRDHPAHRALRPLLDDRECELPVFGPAAVRAGAVRATPEAAGRLLAAGEVLGVFPEGSAGARKAWRDRYTLVHFGRGGFVKVALRAGAPIVPCAIVGSEEASAGISRTGWLAERLGVPLLASNPALRLAPAALVPLPSRWTLRLGPPVETASLGPGAADDPATVNRLAEQVRTTLQAMLDEDVAARSSVFL